MRKFARRLFTLCSAVSLVIAALLTACLIVGHSKTDQADHHRRYFDGARRRYDVPGVASASGRLILYRNTGWSGLDEASHQRFLRRFDWEPTGWRHYWNPAPAGGLEFSRQRWWNRAGFEYADMIDPQPDGVTQRSRQVVMPVLLPLTAAAVLPAIWLRRRTRFRS